MNYSVIYSADVPKGVSISQYRPRQRAWDQTETGESEYAYLEGDWEQGRHGKWCAILTQSQFDAFIDKFNLYMEDVETMGSIGAPGFGFGPVPAFSFNKIEDSYDDGAILNAYVTPFPSIDCKNGGGPDPSASWRRVRQALLNIYNVNGPRRKPRAVSA